MVNFIVNEGPKWVIVGAWLALNIGVFVGTFFQYKNNEGYFYLRELVGDSLSWARASAACLNVNSMLVLLPVCPNLWSFLRGLCGCCHPVRRIMDKNITYHRYIGYMICLHTAIHIGAHYFNFERLLLAHSSSDLQQILTRLPTQSNGTWINPVRGRETDASKVLFTTVAGWSGVIITVCLILIVSSSTEFIRRSYFELFWFAHRLFILYFIGFVVHGIERIIHHQTNLDVHKPETCASQPLKWGPPPCPDPQFEGSGPISWAWVVGPVVLYIIECIIRFVRSRQLVVITKVVKHPSNVFEIQMKKKGFWARPGQYINLHCPNISRLEWHPFTITSAPHEDHITLHIRRVGDWTDALAKKCGVDKEESEEAGKMPRLALDGPFGTSSEDFMDYDVTVLIGAGIGVTPFASILQHLWHLHCDPKRQLTLLKVYLFWICPDMHAFEWFQQLLQSLEVQMGERGDPNFIQHQIYLTRGWDKDQARNIMLHDRASVSDPITGLQQKTHYGRPQWDRIFELLVQNHTGKKVGVFFCGPSQLSTTLHKMCNRFSSSQGAKFYYNKEHF